VADLRNVTHSWSPREEADRCQLLTRLRKNEIHVGSVLRSTIDEQRGLRTMVVFTEYMYSILSSR